jgi:polysaccharide export outer membrane protein
MTRYLAPSFAVVRGSFGLWLLSLVVVGATAPLCAQTIASSQRQAAGETTLAPQTEASQYIIGPGDTVQVFVWRNSDLSETVPVRPDGRISTPLVQNMVAVGKTPAQLAHDMEQVLGQYIRSPQVNIIVTQPVGEFSQIKVIGQVMHPEAVPYHEGMTVLDVVLHAGGLTQYAAGNRAKLVRTTAGKSQQLPVQLNRLMQKGDLSQNLPVKPGDVLVVPESRF